MLCDVLVRNSAKRRAIHWLNRSQALCAFFVSCAWPWPCILFSRTCAGLDLNLVPKQRHRAISLKKHVIGSGLG